MHMVCRLVNKISDHQYDLRVSQIYLIPAVTRTLSFFDGGCSYVSKLFVYAGCEDENAASDHTHDLWVKDQGQIY